MSPQAQRTLWAQLNALLMEALAVSALVISVTSSYMFRRRKLLAALSAWSP
jgi:ABC-type enterochelin transport system permease subunit